MTIRSLTTPFIVLEKRNEGAMLELIKVMPGYIIA